MIEVEIRGRLDDQKFERLTALFKAEGELLEQQDREMILLSGYPGYSEDPIARMVDIRLRNTNGFCEIMVKHKAADDNSARHEVSLALKDTNLDTAKQVLKALGFSGGLWMHRKKDIYRYKNIEWSLVDVPQGLRYFEAEREAANEESIPSVRTALAEEAQSLGLEVLNSEQMKEFISMLDAKVNKDVEW